MLGSDLNGRDLSIDNRLRDEVPHGPFHSEQLGRKDNLAREETASGEEAKAKSGMASKANGGIAKLHSVVLPYPGVERLLNAQQCLIGPWLFSKHRNIVYSR